MAEARGQAVARLLKDAAAAHGRGEIAAARAGYEAVLALVPEQPDALNLLGVIFDQEGRHDEAAALIRRAIVRAPQVAAYRVNLGNALLAQGREHEAGLEYMQAVALDPDCVDGLVNLGNLQSRKGDDAPAERFYAAALQRQPQNTPAHIGMGRVLLNRGQPERAVPHLATAVRAAPASVVARDLLATALRPLARFSEAVLQHRKAIALAPAEPRYHENYAATLIAIDTPKSLADAQQEFETVLARQPQRIEALVGLGGLHVRQQQPQAALAVIERARRQAPDRYDVLLNYSAALALAGRLDEALVAADRLVALFSDHCGALSQRATVREHAGDYAGALADYESALQAQNGRKAETLSDTELKRVLLLLSLGRMAEAWPQYRARLNVRSSDPRGAAFTARLPAWDGVLRPDRRLLVWGEQGVGDQVLFGNMLPDLMRTSAEIVFGCDPRLVTLFRRSLPELDVQPVRIPIDAAEIDRLVARTDMQIGLGDIGMWLRRDLAAWPPPQAYLRPDPARVAEFRRRYAAYGRRRVVGITWHSANPRLGQLKSAALTDWAPVLRQPDVLFVDMQYGDTAADRAAVKAQLGIDILHDDSVDAMQDLDGYAAQAAALDLLVGGSNSGIHIAAAVGTACWILVPSGLGRLWYWHLGRNDSPWYPHVRLFRQPLGLSGDWRATIADLAAALQQYLREGAA